ncbi:sporulation protein [Dactylosporangium sp. NBC_01737]|uniref:sporulation protein n=1 Tax=Dactylosporangium sp. NBC_01737 TaxID=2975959 RepID=UPI002E151936|nr:sporulation protein [Dactylosporangium sp. NBC_01737]
MFGSAMLDERGVRPGTMAAGHVHLGGAGEDLAVDGVTVTLMTVVSGVEVDFLRCPVSAGFTLAAGRSRSIPIEQPLPWETPFTQVAGSHLPAVSVRLRTTVTVAGQAHDVGVDPVTVHPTAGQWRVLDALRRLGWTFPHCEVRQGTVPGVRQSDPFLQWFDCVAADKAGTVRLTCVANPVGADVLLDAGPDGQHRFAVRHDDETTDLAALIEDRLSPTQVR